VASTAKVVILSPAKRGSRSAAAFRAAARNLPSASAQLEVDRKAPPSKGIDQPTERPGVIDSRIAAKPH
jgi:hypothetical protein